MAIVDGHVEIEAWVMVDADGDHVVGADADDLREQWDARIGTAPRAGTRIVCIRVRMPIPEPIQAAIDIPATGGAYRVNLEPV